jgi:hypothetical protein
LQLLVMRRWLPVVHIRQNPGIVDLDVNRRARWRCTTSRACAFGESARTPRPIAGRARMTMAAAIRGITSNVEGSRR